MAEFPKIEEMARNVAEYVLDNFIYDGKSIREWMQIIVSEDCISRQAVLDALDKSKYSNTFCEEHHIEQSVNLGMAHIVVNELKPVTAPPKMGRCKDCKYFEYDSVAKVDGIPLIVAHEICSRWGNGCKTKDDGYCFLFEPKAESEG